jgi:hypothetical protein
VITGRLSASNVSVSMTKPGDDTAWSDVRPIMPGPDRERQIYPNCTEIESEPFSTPNHTIAQMAFLSSAELMRKGCPCASSPTL